MPASRTLSNSFHVYKWLLWQVQPILSIRFHANHAINCAGEDVRLIYNQINPWLFVPMFLSVAPWPYQWLLPEGYQTIFIYMVDRFEAWHTYDSSGSMWIMSSNMLRNRSDGLLTLEQSMVPPSKGFWAISPWPCQWLLPQAYQILFMYTDEYFEVCCTFLLLASMSIMPLTTVRRG